MSWTTCPITGKRGFLCEADALRALRRTQGAARRARKAGRGTELRRAEKRAYLCDCNRWHLTSMSSRDRGIPVDVAPLSMEHWTQDQDEETWKR